MKNECKDCPVWEGDVHCFHGDNKDTTSNSEDSDESENEDCLNYYQWATVDKKACKVLVSLPVDQIQYKLQEKIEELKYHIFVRNEQYKDYNKLKAEMPENSILLHVDYAEKYENK